MRSSSEDRAFQPAAVLVDSHCHLEFPEFSGELDAVLDRAGAAGVTHVLTVSTRIARQQEVFTIAERFSNVYCSLGTHPHYAAEELEFDAEELIARAAHSKVVALGESGLDYHYTRSPPEAQERSFRNHIDAARGSALPLIIHSREADAAMMSILTEKRARGAFSAVLHCYTGGMELAQRAIELGFYIGFTGILTFKSSGALRAIAKSLPADRVLVETDAPYLAPGPYRGKRNEPAYVIETAKVLAEVRGVAFAEVAQQTSENFFRLFGKIAQTATAAA
jgi:TatD DNase family protein